MTYIYLTTRFDPIVEDSDRVLCFREKTIGAVLFRHSFTRADYYKAMHGSAPYVTTKLYRPQTIGEQSIALKLIPHPGSGCIPLEVREGEIVGILDLYGSYWKMLIHHLFNSKLYEIQIGEDHPRNLTQALELGLRIAGVSFQNQMFDDLNMFENLTVGITKRYSSCGIINNRMLRYAYKQLIPDERLLLDPENRLVNHQLLSLMRCVLSKPKILILENLLLTLSSFEKRQIYDILEQLTETGTGIILITSSANECKMLCNRTLVLHDSQTFSWQDDG